MELLFREQELKEQTAYVRALRESEEKAISSERGKFNELRENMRSEQEQREASLCERTKIAWRQRLWSGNAS